MKFTSLLGPDPFCITKSEITGTLVQVGMGKWDVAAFTRIRDAKDRAEAGPTAPPQGLYLTHIDYELD